MNTNTEKKAIETLRTYLNEQKQGDKRLTINEMIYNDEVEEYEDAPGYENEPALHGENQQPEGEAYGEKVPIEKALPSEQVADPEITKIFANIRQAVINGLAKLSHKPESVEYSVMKKILQIVDKPVETQEKQ